MLEALLQALDGGVPDEIVWTADLEYWFAGQRQAGTLDPKWQTERGYLEFCRHLGILPYYWYENFWAARPVYENVQVAQRQDGAMSIQEWSGRTGSLRQESEFSPDSVSWAVTRYPVQTRRDLEILLYILKQRRWQPDNLETYRERMSLWAQYDGLPCLGLPRSPLPAILVEWTGLENGVYLLTDYPDLMGQVIEYMAEQEQVVLNAVCQLAPPLVHFPDNLTSETFTGLFDEYLAGQYRRRLEVLHAAGVRAAVHLDGTVRGLLPKLSAVGFDAVEALTPHPVGDVEVSEMRTLAGNDRVVLWGGVPGAMFAPPFSWNDMEQHLLKLLDTWKGSRFIIGVADQVPPNGNLAFCHKIAKLIRDWEGQKK